MPVSPTPTIRVPCSRPREHVRSFPLPPKFINHKSQIINLSLLLLLSCSTALLFCAGCTPPPPEDPIPKINEINPSTQPINRGNPAQLIIHRAEIEHDANIDKAWSYVSLHGLDPRDVTIWRANGFRVGILSRQDLESFFAALPPRDHDDATTWFTVPENMDAEPIFTSQGNASAREVTFFLPPDTLRTEKLPKGRYQFLVTAKELVDTPGMALTVTPHLYYPALLFYARSPRETVRDGRIFKQLSLSTLLATDRFFVVAIDIPVKLDPRIKFSTTMPAPEPPPPPDTQPQIPLIQPDFDANPEAAPEPSRPTPQPNPNETQTPPATPPAPQPTPEPAAPQNFPDQIDPTSIQTSPYDPATELAKHLEQEWKLADLVLGIQRFQTPYQAVLVFEAVPSSQRFDQPPSPGSKPAAKPPVQTKK
jgi:hypothetical protein